MTMMIQIRFALCDDGQKILSLAHTDWLVVLCIQSCPLACPEKTQGEAEHNNDANLAAIEAVAAAVRLGSQFV